jgi:hypothetical protein
MFARLVPTRNSEELFWKSYFYKVEEAKREMLDKLASSGHVNVTSEHDDFLGDLDNEIEDDNIIPLTPTVPPAASSTAKNDEVAMLKGQLAAALRRIDDLESRLGKVEALFTEEPKEN